MTRETITRYRPTGAKGLEQVHESGSIAWPPRLPASLVLYPVLNEDYAIQIARDWNARDSSTYRGYVTRFQVRAAYFPRYEVITVGSHVDQEYWIPAGDLDGLNANIVSIIEVIREFPGQPDNG